jgi:DNA (cytosine-5)-methyltransferase 1
MYGQLTFLDTPSATSSQGSASGALPCGAPAGATTRPYGPDPALVSLSPRQAKEKGLMTSGTCGPLGSTSSSSRFDPVPVVFGEQVAGPDADPWIDLVCADMERLGYAFGATPFPAASVGAPHIRDRLYWVGYTGGAGRAQQRGQPRQRQPARGAGPRTASAAGLLGDTSGEGLPLRERLAVLGARRREEGRAAEQPGGASGSVADAEGGGLGELGSALGSRDVRHADGGGDAPGGLADANGGYAGAEGLQRGWQHGQQPQDGGALRLADAQAGRQQAGLGNGGGASGAWRRRTDPERRGAPDRPGPVNGFWRSADWILCRDGQWRPVEPGAFPLATGAPARVGRLRAYGNGLNAAQAQVFVECVMEALS